LKANPPHKIWWDFVSYILDYGDFYFKLECVSEVADNQNDSNEALIGQFTKHYGTFVPGAHTELVCTNKKIEELYIVRVFVYFTLYRAFTKTEQLLNQLKQKIKTLLKGKKDPMADIISRTKGVHQEITCHPKAEEVRHIESKYANLIDCGLLSQIDGKYLKAFVQSNSYGFHMPEDGYFYDLELLNDIAKNYEVLKV